MKFICDFLGCKVNSYESIAINEKLIEHGFFEAKKGEKDVDLIVLNTCAVTETSSTKSKKIFRRYRKNYENAIILVMGCASQNDAEYFANNGANIVLGTSHRDNVIELVENYIESKKNIVLVDTFKEIKDYENIAIKKYFDRTRAFVKIQDGCNNFCSYCLIPYIRGRSRSRDSEEILKEIKDLIDNGYKEIVLTGIDQGSYGEDLKEDITFSDLLEKILVAFPELYRIRISSIEESQIDEKFIYLLEKYPNIANHLHIPLQSGSEKVLKDMNRKYKLANFKKNAADLRRIRKNIAITTDVIVGYPTETDEEFLRTYEFIKNIQFSKVHVFPYSDRKGTKASQIYPKVDEKVKKERVHKLLELSTKLEEEYISQFYDQEIEFLVESYDKKLGGYKAHSSNYLCTFIKSDEDIKGQIVTHKYTKNNAIIE